MYNGGSPTLTNVIFTANSAFYGGGLYNAIQATLTNVTFSYNSANYGGGLYSRGQATLSNVTFSDNSVATSQFDSGSGLGGGMFDAGSSSTLTNVAFSGNSATEGGGGLYNANDSETLTSVTFSSNSATGGEGGGILNDYHATLTNVTFSGNYSATNGGGLVNYGQATLTNVTLSGNSSTFDGGGLVNYGQATLTNVTFTGNSANYGGGLVNDYHMTLTNGILWGDSGGEIANGANLPSNPYTVSYSDVQGGFGGTGNINADPDFVDAAGGNLHLLAGSPCIDVGTNTGAPSFDLDGTPRPLDGGTGKGAITDIGAFEFRPVLYVAASATGSDNGGNWANAYTDLQQALALAQPTEQVWVAAEHLQADQRHRPYHLL